MADNDVKNFVDGLTKDLPPELKGAFMDGFKREAKEDGGLTDRPTTLWFARLSLSMETVKKFFKRFA